MEKSDQRYQWLNWRRITFHSIFCSLIMKLSKKLIEKYQRITFFMDFNSLQLQIYSSQITSRSNVCGARSCGEVLSYYGIWLYFHCFHLNWKPIRLLSSWESKCSLSSNDPSECLLHRKEGFKDVTKLRNWLRLLTNVHVQQVIASCK